jgi:DNA mismatch endonuclease (patch repair protein)
MSKIRSKNTKPELFIRSLLHRGNYRFRVNCDPVEGHPDIFFSRKNVAVFIHGCYWHRHHGCKYAYTPKSNAEFWIAKFDANVHRDNKVKSMLASRGIRVLLIWECAIKKMMRDDVYRDVTLNVIECFLNDETMVSLEI